jgi:hypothetical protein
VGSIDLRGTGGTLRVGCRQAATLGAWTCRDDGDGFRVTAKTVTRDAHWLRQAPLALVLPVTPRKPWRWASVQVLDSTSTSLVLVCAGQPEI